MRAADVQGVVVVLGEMVGHAGDARVHIGAAEVLGADHLAGGGLHQRRAAEEDGALVPDDDRLVRHGRHIGAAGGARAHHHRHLRDARGRHVGLVEEDAAEVLAIGKHLVLRRQVGAARIHQVDAGQAVLRGDLLRAQVLLHRDGEVAAALHRGVVGDDHALDALHAADAGDDAAGGDLVVEHAPAGHRRELEEGRAGIEQRVDAVAHEQLAARDMLLAVFRRAAEADFCGFLAQVVNQRAHGGGVGAKFVRAGVELRFDDSHWKLPISESTRG